MGKKIQKFKNKILDNFFQKEMTELVNLELQRKEKEQREQRLEDKKNLYSIGDVLIIRSNEVENLSIGPVISTTEFGSMVLPVIYDYISGGEVISMGITKDFSFDRLNLLLDHTPEEQWLLMTKGLNDKYLMNKEQKERILSKEEVLKILANHGLKQNGE